MKLQSIVLAALLSTAFGGAMAENYTSPVIALETQNGKHWSTGFETTHAIGNFTDTFTFSYSGAIGDAAGFFANVQNRTSNIDFSSAKLNGVELAVFNLGKTSGSISGSYFADVPVNGLLTLVISGKATGDVASYGGTIDVTSAVPEPTTYGMLMGGLGVMAFLARRRKQA